VPGEGFHLPSGGLHAPGTALTIDAARGFRRFCHAAGVGSRKIISKELLFKDVRKEDRERLGERAILNQIDWEVSGDVYFLRKSPHIAATVAETQQAGGAEYWILLQHYRFSGKKVVVMPGQRFKSVDKGVYNVLVWRGRGRYDGHEIKAGDFGYDELLVSHAKADRTAVDRKHRR